jgi:multidrug efflux system outer membrane protein
VKTRLILALTATLMSGCTMAPRYERNALPVAPQFPTGEAYLAPAGAMPPVLDRTLIFQDARLQKLMEQALVNNRDLRVAAANIVRARSQFRSQRAQLLPQIGSTVQLQRSEGATTANSAASGVRTTATANLAVNAYELDLFGRIQSLTIAAQESYFATEATARATRLTLLGDIATAWLTYGADQSLYKLAQETAASARKTLDLTKARLEGGVAPRTDLQQAETTLATAESNMARQKTAVAQDMNALILLVGAEIDPTLLPGSIEEAAPTIGDPPAGTSADILLRRPDVLTAEYNLRSANANIGAARAAMFPKITLTGILGLASGSLESLFGNAGQMTSQVAGAASYPIFQAGASRANLRASEAQRDALLATYEKSIQSAFREVADALARRGTIDDQLSADTRRSVAAEDVFRLSEARYRGGIDSFLLNLDAQRSLYAAQQVLIATRLTAATNRVTLYRVLGGDALTPSANEPAPAPTKQP